MSGDKSLSILYVLFILLFLAIPFVIADGDYDDLTTSVTVQNDAPSVGTITCDPSPFQPDAEASKIINCTATVGDINGYEDLMGIRGEFYNDSLGAANNYTKHYNNATCAFTNNGTTSTNSTVECTFNVYFHADPAYWTIYLNVSDSSGATANNTNTVQVQQRIALNVTETAISFGTVSLGTESSQVTTTIKNTGNVMLDLNINESVNAGYMPCDVGSLQTDAASTGVRYNTTNSFDYDSASWKLTSGNDLRDLNWAKSSEAASSTPPEYSLYWKLKLPSTGLSGSCSTTTRISATAG